MLILSSRDHRDSTNGHRYVVPKLLLALARFAPLFPGPFVQKADAKYGMWFFGVLGRGREQKQPGGANGLQVQSTRHPGTCMGVEGGAWAGRAILSAAVRTVIQLTCSLERGARRGFRGVVCRTVDLRG